MGLQAETPLRVVEAVANRLLRIGDAAGAVHGLQKEVAEGELGQLRGVNSLLGKDQLELITGVLHEWRAGFWADANPVQRVGGVHGSVGLHSDLELARVQSLDERLVELEQRFAAGADDESFSAGAVCRPLRRDCVGEGVGVTEFPAARSI